jgi:hypothetical protein
MLAYAEAEAENLIRENLNVVLAPWWQAQKAN